jgi:hypothetical protein
VNHLEIEICKVNEPPGLAVIQGLGLAEIRKVFMVSECLDREWGSMEIVAPGFKGADDS